MYPSTWPPGNHQAGQHRRHWRPSTTRAPRPAGEPAGRGPRERKNYFLPWFSRGNAASWVFPARQRFSRPPGGRRWSPLATVAEPRTAQRRPGVDQFGPLRLTAGQHPFGAMRPEAQPPPASQDGGFANRKGARIPGRTPTGPSHATEAVDQTSPRPPKSHQKPQCVFSSIYQGRKKEIGAYTSVHTSPGCHPQLAVTIPVLHYREATPTISAPLLISRTASQLWPGPAPNVQ